MANVFTHALHYCTFPLCSRINKKETKLRKAFSLVLSFEGETSCCG